VLTVWTRRKKIIFVATAFFVLVVLLTVGFIYAGSLLVVEAPPQRADVGLVLAGHFGRALYAADLYHQGFIPRIWISRPEREKYLVQLDSIGVPYPRQEEISRAVLLKKGVPDDRIEVIGDGMVSTIAEARFVAGLLKKQPEIHSVLLITSRFHVRRAQAIFDRVVVSAFPVHIMTVGSPYDGFIADQWWRDRDSAREVLLESAKLFLFWTKEEF
jgi:uncharacterized SAM-binding protein YcdF (DUF218 family)